MSAPAGAVPQDSPDAGAYTTNGPVRAIAHAFGRTYIGGEFTRVGQRSGPGVVLSSAGAPATFPEVAGGEVHAAISDGNGGWFIGGSFTSVGNETRLGIAHVKADGSVDSNFEAAVTTLQGSPAAVYALLLSPPHANGERTLYVGGEFAQIGAGEPEIHSNIAALKASTGEPVSAFGPATDCVATQKPGCSPAVRSLALAHIELPFN